MVAFVYVASSCDIRLKIGGWSAVIAMSDNTVKTLSGYMSNTTQNYLLLLAILKAVRYLKNTPVNKIILFTDSRYIFNIFKHNRYSRANKNARIIKEIFKESNSLNLQIELCSEDAILLKAKSIAKHQFKNIYKNAVLERS